jgi:DNA anti-recombination protein RmuC
MAEVEYKGIKVGGSKLLLIIPLIGTIIGGLWGGFEAYQRYLSMEKKIANFVSPDLSHIDNHMVMVDGELRIIQAEFDALKEVDAATGAVIREQINSVKAIAATLQTDLHDLRMDLNQDTAELNNAIEVKSDKQESRLEKQDARNRQNIEDVRGVINTFELRFESTIKSFEERMDSKMFKLDQKLDNLEEALDKKIQRAIDNPLAGN